MIDEFSRIIAVADKLDKNHAVLQESNIAEHRENIIYFTKEKKKLMADMDKLANISKEFVQTITPSTSSDVGPISMIFSDLYLEVGDYQWQFYTMKDFLKLLVSTYRHKANQAHCAKEYHKNNPILTHIANSKYVSTIPEIEQLISLLALHNNYLGKNQILTAQEINMGIDAAKELSAMSIDIQEILDKLEQPAINDICSINSLLRHLYGKIAVSAECIHTINWDIIRIIGVNYPDWNHASD